MSKRIISLFLAVLIFASMGVYAFADKEEVEYKVGAETMKMICDKQGLDYDFCKDAIILINAAFSKEEDFSTMTVGQTIKLPKSNQAAAEIRNVALPDKLKPKATGETQEYTIKDKDTMIDICKAKSLTYDKCKAAILKLNGWTDYNLLHMKTGTKIKLPKTDADAAVIAASTGTATGSSTSTGTITLWGGDAVAAYLIPYVVKTGETLYGICQANGVDFNRYINLIMQASGIVYASSLHTGDVVYLPSATSASGALTVVSHTVAGGETVYGICQALGIDYNSRYNLIVALNPSKNLNSIHTGEVIYLPSGGTSGGTSGGGASGGSTGGSTAGGYSSGYTPASSDPATTPAAFKPVEGVNFYLKEITIATDNTVYGLVKAAGFDYTTYYANVLLAANNLATFNNLKDGDKLLMLSPNYVDAKIAVKGIAVKKDDTVTKMCEAAGIKYDDYANLIAKLNVGLNFNNLKVDDIVLLPVKP